MKTCRLIYRLFLPLLLLMSGAAIASTENTPEKISGTTKVTAEMIFELFETHDDLVIIDSRTAQDRSKGYIEGSLGIPDGDTTPEVLAQNIPTKSTPVVFYCNGPKCGRSVKTSKMAVASGFTKVFWFRGGWEEWSSKGLPVSKD